MDNLRIFQFYIPYYFMQWYSILIYLGIFLIIVRERSNAGITLLAIGGVFFLEDVFRLDFLDLWPVILIAVGVSILVRRNSGEERRNNPDDVGSNSSDYIDEMVVFSGAKKYLTSKNFRGGKITTIFGGADIDLRDTRLAEGVNVIDVFSMFGGSTVIVPPDWKVTVKVNPIFGGYADKRVRLHDVEVSGSELVITGTIIFGGGEIKSA